MDLDGTEEFFKHTLTSAEGQKCIAIHGFLWPKGGDRAVYRNIYAISRELGGPTVTATQRVPEALSPESTTGKAFGERPELPPVRSYHDSLNEALDELTRRCVVQMEGAFKTRVTYAAIDYVIDENDKPWLLWPHDIRTLDINGETGKLDVEEEILPLPPPPPSTLPVTKPSQRGDLAGAQEAAAAAEKYRQAQDEAARATALQRDFMSLLSQGRVGDGGRGSILLVDSEPGPVIAAVEALTGVGFAVTLLDDAAAALTLIRTTPFDAMLLNRDLPSLSGIEAVKLLRTREAGRNVSRPGVAGNAAYHLTVVAFTQYTSPEDLTLYRTVGFDGCVAKPVDSMLLISTMSAAVPAPANYVPPPPTTRASLESAARARASGGVSFTVGAAASPQKGRGGLVFPSPPSSPIALPTPGGAVNFSQSPPTSPFVNDPSATP